MSHEPHSLTDAQLIRAIQSCGDFQQALSALTFLVDDCDYAVKYSTEELRRFQCYENAAIVAFARPFEVSRGRSALGLRAVGIRLSAAEERLKGRVIALRRKVVAHSDEELMHFKISAERPFEDSPIALPLLIFQEFLRLDAVEVQEMQDVLRKLVRGLAKMIFALAQSEPDRLNIYKLPAPAPTEYK